MSGFPDLTWHVQETTQDTSEVPLCSEREDGSRHNQGAISTVASPTTITSCFHHDSDGSGRDEHTQALEARVLDMDLRLLHELSSGEESDSDWGFSGHHTALPPSSSSHGTPSQQYWDPSSAFTTTTGLPQPMHTTTMGGAALTDHNRLHGGVVGARTRGSSLSTARSTEAVRAASSDVEAERAWQLLQQFFPGSISLQAAQQSQTLPMRNVCSAAAAPLPPPPYGAQASPPFYTQSPQPAGTGGALNDGVATPVCAGSTAHGHSPTTGTHPTANNNSSGHTNTPSSGGPHTASSPSTQREEPDVHVNTLRALLEQYNTVFYAYPSSEELLALRQQQLEQPPQATVDDTVTTIAPGAHSGDDEASHADLVSVSAAESACAIDSNASSSHTRGTFTVTTGEEDDDFTTAHVTATPTSSTTRSLSPSLSSALPSSGTSLSWGSLTQLTSDVGSDVRRRNDTGTKVFLGGLRFEVVQMGRAAISWIFERACGVRLEASSVLIHRKSKNGKHPGVSPTGCASVYVSDEHHAVQTLLSMNQRIFCAQDGIFVAPSSQIMKALVTSRQLLDVSSDGKVRGPAHPIVVELANTGGGEGSQKHARSHRGSEASGLSAARQGGRGGGGGGGGVPSSSSLAATDGGSATAHTARTTPSTTPMSTGLSPGSENHASSAAGARCTSARAGSHSAILTPRSSRPNSHFHSRTSSQSSALGLVGPTPRTPTPHTPPAPSAAINGTGGGGGAKSPYASMGRPGPSSNVEARAGVRPPPPPTYAAATAYGVAPSPPLATAYTVPPPSTVYQTTAASSVSFSPNAASSLAASGASLTGSQAGLRALFGNGVHLPPPPPFPSTASVTSHTTHALPSTTAAAIPGLLFHSFPGDERVEREQHQLRRGSTWGHHGAATPNVAPGAPPQAHHSHPDRADAGTSANTSTGALDPATESGVALFLGGLAVGATAAYTVWLLSRLGVTVHLGDVTMLPAAACSTGVPTQSSAVVRVANERDAETVIQQGKRLLCVPRGCYMVPHPLSSPSGCSPSPNCTGTAASPVTPTSEGMANNGPHHVVTAAGGAATCASAHTPLALQTLLDSNPELAKLSLFSAARRQGLPGVARPPLPRRDSAHAGSSALVDLARPPPPPAYAAATGASSSAAPATSTTTLVEALDWRQPAADPAVRPPPLQGYNAAVQHAVMPSSAAPLHATATAAAAAADATHLSHTGQGKAPGMLSPPPQYYAATGRSPAPSYTAPPPPSHASASSSSVQAQQSALFVDAFPPPPSHPTMTSAAGATPATSMAPAGTSAHTASAVGSGVASGPQTMYLFGQSYQLAPGTSIQFIPVITTTNMSTGTATTSIPPTGVLPPPPLLQSQPQYGYRQ